ncbi:MAG: hypothetical protein HC904_14710 [Blastochloris sp.]|nr:hypothetical protein [Blastochloris sp.]
MITLKHWHFGFIGAGGTMVVLYCIFWFLDVLFLGGDYDPLGLVALPLAACIYSALAFWLIIFPIAHLVGFTLNKLRIDHGLLWGSGASSFLCTIFGFIFGIYAGDELSGLLWAFYGAAGGFLFFILSATTKQT